MKSEEIAKLAGVSRSTVSRVLNNSSYVSKEARDKILKVIQEYKYVPNHSAQVLAGKSSNVIGLFIIAKYDTNRTNGIYNDNYFAPLLDAVVDRANYNDSYVLVNTIYTENDYDKIREAYFQKRIDSVIIVGNENAHLIELMELGIPMVMIGYDPVQLPRNVGEYRIGVIHPTDYEGACDAMEFLISLGHRQIGILNGNFGARSARERFRAYRDIMKRHQLPIQDEYVLQGDYRISIAAERVEAMIKEGSIPSALFCANDDMALCAMKVFHNYGIKIPHDISIIGFDDIPLASHITPPLTTIKVSIYHIAEEAIKCIKKLTVDKKPVVEMMQVSTELIVRDSCKKLEG